MKKAVYIATTEPNSGKSILSLGMMQLLLGKTAKVGYFRPIIDDPAPGSTDNHINTVIGYFNLDQDAGESYALTRSEVIRKKNRDQDDEIIAKIIEKYKALEKRCDFMLVEGTSFSGEGSIIEFDINIIIAKNLGIPAMILANGMGKSGSELMDHLLIAYDSFMDKGVEVLAVVANKVPAESLGAVREQMRAQLPPELLGYAIPLNPALGNPTIKEIVENLDAKVLFGHAFINNQVDYYSVGAMQLRNYLLHLKENGLVVTPGDRADIILGALQAHSSTNYPTISGIVLTGGLIPEDTIIRLIQGLSDVVPIISVEGGTFDITNRIGNIKSRIYPGNTQKILASIKDFETYVEVDILAERVAAFRSSGMTPRMFRFNLLTQAQAIRKHIVLPEGTDPRILRATKQLIDLDAVEITLLGEPGQIADQIGKLEIGLDIEKIHIIDPVDSPQFETYVVKLHELRRHKNVNLAMARDLMEDVSYFGTMMVYMGHADGMVSGAVHTTQHTILPALQFIKTVPGVSIVSSVFFMCLENRVSVFGDCAINPNPTAEQLAEIAISSAETSRAFGIEPRIAMLSYSSGTSGIGADVDRVRQATDLVRKLRPDLKVAGPIQYDAAVDLQVGRAKMPESEVAGQATVFIFPDLNTGNNTYKAVQRETRALAIGPVIQGLRKPVNDLSRGCTVEDIFNTVIITAIQAQGKALENPQNKAE